jgi:hypothetical protein
VYQVVNKSATYADIGLSPSKVGGGNLPQRVQRPEPSQNRDRWRHPLETVRENH